MADPSVRFSRPAPRAPGLSVRVKLTLSYAALVIVAGVLLLGVVALYLLRYVPEENLYIGDPRGGSYAPNRGDLIRAFVPAVAWVLVALLLVGVVGGWFLAGRMLRPLTAIGDAARLAAAGSLTHRIGMPGRQDEFRELADVFDAMLARIEGDVERQRRFAANASHELRTPLSVTRTLLDVAEAEPDPDVPALLARLRGANDRAIDLTEALLLLARIDARPPKTEPVDLSLAAEEAAELLHGLAATRGVRIGTAIGPVAVRGDRALLTQLATNLLQNAIVHNLPLDGFASIAIVADAHRAWLIVENTGNAIDPAVLPTLVEPFQRGSQRTRGTAHGGGSGLGLAIAASIVDALGGALVLHVRAEGGLRVEASFPLAHPLGH
ncbi:two-component system sensor histidine kinase VanS [Microbacterium resistens]|uniref:histidine kinase n=1 Tax=Microbacterium resistens TaxID=156977 RepID=A0ABU1SDG1_9MICO|nr:HAMP domain-containing sensor histidine kinase [Microbacterium resistens]MDR6866932.1 two-component system sensor histidine kinase VanS [Microbacterium resistens]